MNLDKKCPHQQRVDLFMAMMRSDKQHTPPIPIEPSKPVRVLRAQLMLEECLETIQKGLGIVIMVPNGIGDGLRELNFDDLKFSADKQFDMIETVDGLADCDVVNIGTASACGVAQEPITSIVDCNNMAKFAPGHSFNEHGKLIKPKNHHPPTEEINLELRRQGWTGPTLQLKTPHVLPEGVQASSAPAVQGVQNP